MGYILPRVRILGNCHNSKEAGGIWRLCHWRRDLGWWLCFRPPLWRRVEPSSDRCEFRFLQNAVVLHGCSYHVFPRSVYWGRARCGCLQVPHTSARILRHHGQQGCTSAGVKCWRQRWDVPPSSLSFAMRCVAVVSVFRNVPATLLYLLA